MLIPLRYILLYIGSIHTIYGSVGSIQTIYGSDVSNLNYAALSSSSSISSSIRPYCAQNIYDDNILVLSVSRPTTMYSTQPSALSSQETEEFLTNIQNSDTTSVLINPTQENTDAVLISIPSGNNNAQENLSQKKPKKKCCNNHAKELCASCITAIIPGIILIIHFS